MSGVIMSNELDLAELICAKYSHDLAGPIGAINNGVEFLSGNDKDMKEKAIDLIRLSAEQAVVKLQFLRQVFGYVKEESELSLSDIIYLCNLFFSLTKIKLIWNYDQNNESLSQFKSRFAKLIFNFLNLSATILIVAGEVVITLVSNNQFTIEVSGEKIILDQYLIDVLKGEVALVDVSTKNAHICYLVKLIADVGAAIDIKQQDKSVVITVKMK